MGQTGSKAATRLRLPRGSGVSKPADGKLADGAQGAAPRMATREEMLAEDDGKENTLQDNLKYFLSPRELLTPITPANPEENANFRALTNRRDGTAHTVKSEEVAQMLRELRHAPSGREAAARASATYGLDPATVRKLSRFLEPTPGA